MIVKTAAIVLRARRVRETSAWLVLYTEAFGKIAVMVRGVRQARSRLRGLLEPFNELTAVLYRREHRSVHYLSDADLVHARAHLRTNLDALADAFAVAELVDAVLHDEEPHPELFRLLRDVLCALDAPQGPEPTLVVRFQLALARVLGFAPVLDRCVACGRVPAAAQPVWFAPDDGGIRCAACGGGATGTRLDEAAYKILGSPDGDGPRTPITVVRTVRGMLNAYLLRHSGSSRVLRSPALDRRTS